MLCLCYFRRKPNFLSGEDGLVVWTRSSFLILMEDCISLWVNISSYCFRIFLKPFCSYGKIINTSIQYIGTLKMLKYHVKIVPQREYVPAFCECLLFDAYSGQALGVFLPLITTIKTGGPGPPGLATALRARVASVVPFYC